MGVVERQILRILIFIVMLLFMCAATICAQEVGRVVAPLNGEYIREWLVLGPFFPDDLEMDFLAGTGGDANIQPQEGDSVTTAEGVKLTWKRYKAKRSSADLADAIGDHKRAAAYAFCILQSKVAGNVQVCLGHSNGAVLWINGKRVYHNSASAARDESVFEVDLEAGENHCLIKVSQGLGSWSFAMRVFPPNSAVISGIITDEVGKPIFEASVRLEQDGEEITQVQTDELGNYCLGTYPVRGFYDISATSGDLGDRSTSVSLREGEHRRLNFTLRKAISIEGTLLMLDNITPHVAVLVEAIMIRRGEPRVHLVASTLSDNGGKYRFINLKPGKYQVRCQIPGGYVYYGEEKAEKPESQKAGE